MEYDEFSDIEPEQMYSIIKEACAKRKSLFKCRHSEKCAEKLAKNNKGCKHASLHEKSHGCDRDVCDHSGRIIRTAKCE